MLDGSIAFCSAVGPGDPAMLDADKRWNNGERFVISDREFRPEGRRLSEILSLCADDPTDWVNSTRPI